MNVNGEVVYSLHIGKNHIKYKYKMAMQILGMWYRNGITSIYSIDTKPKKK